MALEHQITLRTINLKVREGKSFLADDLYNEILHNGGIFRTDIGVPVKEYLGDLVREGYLEMKTVKINNEYKTKYIPIHNEKLHFPENPEFPLNAVNTMREFLDCLNPESPWNKINNAIEYLSNLKKEIYPNSQ